MSETRNILDSLGNTIGQLTLPDGTAESVWTGLLAPYAVANPVIVPLQILKTFNLNASDQISSSSATAVAMNGLSVVPDAGVYVVQFSGAASTNGASASGEFGIYIDGVLVAETRRDISCNLALLGGLVTISLNQIAVGLFSGTQILVNGSQAVDVRYRSTNGGTIGFKERSLVLMKVQ